MDVILSATGLVLTLPLSIILAIIIWIDLSSPVFFVQERVGLGGVPFRMLKFRTMRDDRDENGCLLPDELRITRVGRILRRLRLDEIPELINVLVGQMSLVGPRPLRVSSFGGCDLLEQKRYAVRPGLTGWAQVNGNTLLSWREKLALDVWYVDHISLGLDIQVLLATIAVVIRGERINRKKVQEALKHAAYSCGHGY